MTFIHRPNHLFKLEIKPKVLLLLQIRSLLAPTNMNVTFIHRSPNHPQNYNSVSSPPMPHRSSPPVNHHTCHLSAYHTTRSYITLRIPATILLLLTSPMRTVMRQTRHVLNSLKKLLTTSRTKMKNV